MDPIRFIILFACLDLSLTFSCMFILKDEDEIENGGLKVEEDKNEILDEHRPLAEDKSHLENNGGITEVCVYKKLKINYSSPFTSRHYEQT